MFLFMQKDIVLVPFPFTDGSTSKRRPVLIISTNKINGVDSYNDFIGVAITSRIRNGTYGIRIDNGDIEEGSLPQGRSEIQCNKIATILKNLIIKKIGKINNTTFATIRDKITNSVLS